MIKTFGAFKIYNKDKKSLQIEAIELMGGAQSVYSINVDGVPADLHQDPHPHGDAHGERFDNFSSLSIKSLSDACCWRSSWRAATMASFSTYEPASSARSSTSSRSFRTCLSLGIAFASGTPTMAIASPCFCLANASIELT